MSKKIFTISVGKPNEMQIRSKIGCKQVEANAYIAPTWPAVGDLSAGQQAAPVGGGGSRDGWRKLVANCGGELSAGWCGYCIVEKMC
ncbi:MAG: hypothetical protein PUD39_02585 [Bacteroidales bacterium]|nr:hypothetical protein [Bacteroidales bacterium]